MAHSTLRSFVLDQLKVRLAVFAALLVIVGCGDGRPERATVVGKVTYNDEPVRIGSLVFVPVGGGPSAQGKIDRDGQYFMGTYEEDDGVIPGEYKVMIVAMTSAGGSGLPEDATDGNAGVVSVIPERYGDLEKSGLKITVEANKENSIDFKLNDEPAPE